MEIEEEELNEKIVQAIIYKVIAEERKFLKQDGERTTEIVRKHMATIKEFVNVNSKH
ncbi:MAG: hypothetical protein IKR28_03640 [Selenomonadaceae bacterium]|nr:hypothetical protein [Selenomonadaceae bacterium]